MREILNDMSESNYKKNTIYLTAIYGAEFFNILNIYEINI